MTIDERLAATLSDLAVRWPKREPKAFYLTLPDWTEFMAIKRPRVRTMFGNNPRTEVEEPGFEGVPVRASTSKQSRLYDSTTTGRPIR